jgi:hypothetical protein
MKSPHVNLAICVVVLFNFSVSGQSSIISASEKNRILLFDGKTFNGWEGDTAKTWRIEDNAIVGGSFEETVTHNFFLATIKQYSNFILKLKFKLIGKEGFINAGVQFRSGRMTDPSYEMKGYQADLGPNYWASLYDESRRNITLVFPDSSLIEKILKPGGWNDFEVRAKENSIEIFLNGHRTIRYEEADQAIPKTGIIGLQVHGGGKTVVWYKDIFLEQLP